MKDYKTAILAAVWLCFAAGCDIRNEPKGTVSTPPGVDSYTVTVTEVEIVNKDNGETLDVEGLPIQGGTLVVE